MIIYLVNISRRTSTLQFPIGLGHIAKALLLNGYEFRIIDLIPFPQETRSAQFEHFLRSVRKPAIFGFSITAGNGHILEVDKLSRLVRQADPGHIIVYGGPLPSSAPRLCLLNTPADYIIAGEGEDAFIAFLGALKGKEFNKVNNLIYRDGDGAIIENKKIRIKNLDRYHPIPYDYFDMDFYNGYLKETDRCFEISGSRGCRGACTFCFRYSGPGLTSRSAENIFQEIKYIYGKYNINKFNFVDENFLEQKDVFSRLLELLKRDGINIRFRGQTRVDEITDEYCGTLVKQGLMGINFGVESASNFILENVGKGIKIEDIERKIALLQSFGVDVYVSVIVGFPWETKDTIAALAAFIARNNLQRRCIVNYLTPLPSTRLYEEVRGRGLIQDEWNYILSLGDLYKDLSLNLTQFPRRDIEKYFNDIIELGERSIPAVSDKYSGIILDENIKNHC